MSRNGSGTYTIPNTLVDGATITASGHNENYADISTALTDSVATDGQSPMTGPLRAINGTVTASALTFVSDTSTGIYRIGASNVGVAAGGTKILDIASTGLSVTGALNATGAIKQNGFQVYAPVAQGTFSTATELSLVLTTYTGYRGFRFMLTDVSTSASTSIRMRTSTNAGVSYDTGASDYAYIIKIVSTDSAVVTLVSDDADTSMFLHSTSSDTSSSEVTLYAPSTAGKRLIRSESISFVSGFLTSSSGAGSRLASADIDAVRFLPATGTFTGAYAVFGIP